MRYELGFLGAGNMAEAIARAAIDSGTVKADKIIASDKAQSRLMLFAEMGVTATEVNYEVLEHARQVLIAVKPQTFGEIAGDMAQHAGDEQVYISIMAGLTTAKICEQVGKPLRVVRVMPNTPLMAGAGMAGVALGEHTRPGDDELALKLLRSAGEAVRVDEKLIDAVTAISGSGPAYVFYLAEAMEQAARELGLADHAPLLVRQTILGAAKLMGQAGDPPAELRRKVTSPGGTTEAAVKQMETNQMRDMIVSAIKAAHARSVELGK